MPTEQELKEQARARARAILSQTPSFQNMGRAEQMELYKEIVATQHRELAQNGGLARSNNLSQQNRLSTQLGDRGASQQIDETRHENKDMDKVGTRARDFVDSVDFPEFVKELLKAVFDANMEVSIKQMEEYQRLMKAATADLSAFVNKLDDKATFQYLAENHNDQFNLDFSDDAGAQGAPVLTDKSGNAVDLGDNAVKEKIMQAKLAMAQEHRALLRETILMGISRLVVEKGKVTAKVVFDVKANDTVTKTDQAKARTIETAGSTSSGGFWPFYSGGGANTSKKASISVSSAKSTATTNLAAQITGEVEINFKSDYFKLDNFAQMYPAAPAAPAKSAQTPKTGE